MKNYDSEIKCSECKTVIERYKSANKSVIIKGYRYICDVCWRKIEKQNKEIQNRLNELEKEVFPDLICDNCGKKATFQAGENKKGEIGSWCCNKCLDEYKYLTPNP